MHVKFLAGLAAGRLAGPPVMTSAPDAADLLLVNANVLTMDPARPHANAVAITGGRIRALPGDAAEVRAAQVVDLRGTTLLPGFHDAHNHMTWFGMSLSELDLRAPAVSSLDELYQAVARRAEATEPGGWVIGAGYDQNKIGGHPERDALDRAAPGRRVWLRHTSGHMCVVSSAVLSELGIDADPAQVPGGRVDTDAAGRPTGLLEERAQQLVAGLVHPYPLATLAEAIDRAGTQYLAEGITSCTEAGIGGGWIGRSPVELAAYQAARDQGRLRVRVELMIASDVLHQLASHAGDGLELGLDLGLRTGFGDDWLRLGATKVFADGSLVGRTAAMHDDYENTPGENGYLQADAAASCRPRSSPRTVPAGRSPPTRSATARSTWSSTPTRGPSRSTRARTRGTASSTSPRPAPIRSPGRRSWGWSRCRRAGSPASWATGCSPPSAHAAMGGSTGSAPCCKRG